VHPKLMKYNYNNCNQFYVITFYKEIILSLDYSLFNEYLKLLNRLYDITWLGITIISCDYLNLSLEDEHIGDVTIPTQVIEYNQNFLQAD